MSKVVNLKAWNSKERLRLQLVTAIKILHHHANSPVTEELLVAVEHLCGDIQKAVEEYRSEQQ